MADKKAKNPKTYGIISPADRAREKQLATNPVNCRCLPKPWGKKNITIPEQQLDLLVVASREASTAKHFYKTEKNCLYYEIIALEKFAEELTRKGESILANALLNRIRAIRIAADLTEHSDVSEVSNSLDLIIEKIETFQKQVRQDVSIK